jgi:type II secretory pathway pseudopilin PulG
MLMKRLIGLAVALFVVVSVLGIGTALVRPNLIATRQRQNRALALKHLHALAEAQRLFKEKNSAYASGPDCFKKLGWRLIGKSNYSFYCDTDQIPCTGTSCQKCPAPNSATLKLSPISIIAVGNIDDDQTCDELAGTTGRPRVLIDDMQY